MHAVDGGPGQEPAGKLTALLPPAKYLAVHAQAHFAGIQPGHLFSESNRKIIRYDIFKASQLCVCVSIRIGNKILNQHAKRFESLVMQQAKPWRYKGI